ncbi:YbaN family protein [Seleniivibrio sp.]|uniref:YbaN family protein n=1 Tax=Seleniivibrio sp. TaxID=2898801 RepID=UPI0025CCBC52|nr:YbaN family protein [Seleniivibrio sp.]MCD8553428.1 YbaN family protein [Seleniivibrio sp.]
MKKGFMVFFGSVFTVLGLVGVFVPVLPTTPFLLLASFCYVRSSEKLNNWLINHRIFGAYIGSYMKYRAVRKDMKIRAVFFLWGSLILSALLVRNVHVAAILLIVGIGVTAYIVSLKTMTAEMEERVSATEAE